MREALCASWMVILGVLMSFEVSMAQEPNCMHLNNIRSHAKTLFKDFRQGPLTSEEMPSNYVMDGAKRCYVEVFERNVSRYACEWSVARVTDSSDYLLAEHLKFTSNVGKCIAQPHRATYRKRERGGTWSIVDTDSETAATEASVDISYRIFSREGIIEFAFTVAPKEK